VGDREITSEGRLGEHCVLRRGGAGAVGGHDFYGVLRAWPQTGDGVKISQVRNIADCKKS